ncbi:MAG TPA: DNA polymerase III subunit delta [Candidatus Dormibacteraeota bacterium]|nr:DNA polymerase III subunit delta [Candidatus Dormibacteraeota bacterium]
MPASAAERLFAELKKGQAPAAILLLGDDSYWRQLCRQKLTESLVPEAAREWALGRLSAARTGVAEVVGRAQMRPMLAPRQLLFVEDAGAWEQGSDDSLKENLALLAAYLENPAPFTVLVLEAAKLDQRTRLSKLLNQHALVVDLGASATDPAPMALQMARELGVEMEPAAAAALAEASGGNAARVANEVEKLACYVAPGGRITARDVRDLVVAEGAAEVWELAGLLASGKRGGAIELVDELLRKGDSAPQLVGALAWMFRKLVEASELPPGTNSWQAARRLGMRPDSAGTAIEHARRIPRAQLRQSLVALAEADDCLKSAGADDRAIMVFLVAQLSRLGAGRGEKGTG